MNEELLERLTLEQDKRLIHSQGFLPYCRRYCKTNGLILAKHQVYIAHKLEIAMTTPNYRLMIKVGPGYAKSTYGSILAPTYYVGKFPKRNVIMTTHTQEFSDRWGRRCRSEILEPDYNYIFNTTLRQDSAAVNRFDLLNGSSYYSSGILGSFTGLRGDIVIGDDWFSGIEAADSETIRQKIWNAYIWDLRTRLKPGGSIILIGTPWHEDDHFGRILLSKDRDKWDVIEMPAIIETEEEMKNDVLGRKMGETLWPEYITLEQLNEIKDSLSLQDMRMWNSLYQVKPTIETGDYFKAENWQEIPRAPQGLQYYGASDYAVTHGDGDYTVHGIVGFDEKTNDAYVVDVWREQTQTDVWVDEFMDLVDHYKPLMWGEESGQIIKSLNPYIEKMFQDPKRRYVYRKQFTSTTNKTSRARAIQAWYNKGKVYFLKAPWTETLRKEMMAFPAGKHDDQVDMLSLIGRMLNEIYMTVEKIPKKEDYEYKSSTIVLPGLDFKMNRPRAGLRNKI